MSAAREFLEKQVRAIENATEEKSDQLRGDAAYAVGRFVAIGFLKYSDAFSTLCAAGMDDRSEAEKAAREERLKVVQVLVRKRLDDGVRSVRGLDIPGRIERPIIMTAGRQLRDVVADAQRMITEIAHHVRLYRRGGALVRIEFDDGKPVIKIVDLDICRGILIRYANWMKVTRDAVVESVPPNDVVRDLVAIVPDVPILESILKSPAFSADGKLLLEPGYHPDSRVFLQCIVDVPAVSAHPNRDEVQRAVELLREVYQDFPLTAPADVAHVLAALIQPFVRAMISGVTPLVLVRSTTPGTGKGLLVSAITAIAFGHESPPSTLPERQEEVRKRITASLMSDPTVVLLDNLRPSIDSGELAAAITAINWTDRILGLSKMVELPNRALWLMTGNNPQLSLELARRAIQVRLDADLERPWTRAGFKHDPLLDWVTEQRPQLVHAVLTIIQAWLAAGRPPCSTKPLGGFETWSRVIGGILENAGVEGFLADQDELWDAADEGDQEWREFLPSWWAAYVSRPVGVGELRRLAETMGMLDGVLGAGNVRSQKVRLGRALRALVGRRFGRYRIESHRDTNKHRYVYMLVVSPQEGE